MSSSPRSVPDAPPVADLFVPVDDGQVSLHVRHRPVTGTAGRPFILLHGLMNNARMWDDVADRLCVRGHPVYAVDQRGHGLSDSPADGYDNAAAAGDVAAICAELGLAGALVAGHSWSGNLALRLAVEHPALVAGVALVDGGWYDFDEPGAEEFWDNVASVFRRAMVGTTTAAVMYDYLRRIYPRWSESAIQARLADFRPGPDGLLVPRLSDGQISSILRSLRDEAPGRWLPHVGVPVMLLPVVPTASARLPDRVRRLVGRAEAALARPTVRWYEDADHHVHADEPDRVAGDLLDLASEVGPPEPDRGR